MSILFCLYMLWNYVRKHNIISYVCTQWTSIIRHRLSSEHILRHMSLLWGYTMISLQPDSLCSLSHMCCAKDFLIIKGPLCVPVCMWILHVCALVHHLSNVCHNVPVMSHLIMVCMFICTQLSRVLCTSWRLPNCCVWRYLWIWLVPRTYGIEYLYTVTSGRFPMYG